MPENERNSSAGRRKSALKDIQGITIGETPAWGTESAERFLDTVLSGTELFPCTFAVAAARKSTLRLGYVDGTDRQDDWAGLPDLLRRYLDEYRSLSKETSLVVLFRPEDEPRTMDAYRDRFWAVLRYLVAKDSQPWPAELPTDPDDRMWEFAFGGTPIFVVCNTPVHDRRRSRHADQFMITFQPRWVFEGLEAETPRGAAARRTIRARLSAYDTVAPSPVLGSYGDADNREWRQYFLADDNVSAAGVDRCPFLAGRAAPRPAEPVAAGRPWTVVSNDAGRYSVWEAGRDLPAGWRTTGASGTRDACLDHIAALGPSPARETR
ncbi:YqcI/YcgG family protein [Streptomyces sp. NPDC048182]|uniref:YqcI/YcgG family protein n=1 Tax=Streptomyces sp. NPDC048182 TaxID=3365507 RepID=UPI0037248759